MSRAAPQRGAAENPPGRFERLQYAIEPEFAQPPAQGAQLLDESTPGEELHRHFAGEHIGFDPFVTLLETDHPRVESGFVEIGQQFSGGALGPTDPQTVDHDDELQGRQTRAFRMPSITPMPSMRLMV